MTPEEAKIYLQEVGAIIRLSELPDEIVFQQVVVDLMHGIAVNKLDLNSGQLAEMLSNALVQLGGFHRQASCGW